jgi:hypothetical protein
MNQSNFNESLHCTVILYFNNEYILKQMCHKCKINCPTEKKKSLLCSACWRDTVMSVMHFSDYVSIETEYTITHISAFQKTLLVLDLGKSTSCMGCHNFLLNIIKHKCQTCLAALHGKRNVNHNIQNVSKKFKKGKKWKMQSSGMLCHVALVRTNVLDFIVIAMKTSNLMRARNSS